MDQSNLTKDERAIRDFLVRHAKEIYTEMINCTTYGGDSIGWIHDVGIDPVAERHNFPRAVLDNVSEEERWGWLETLVFPLTKEDDIIDRLKTFAAVFGREINNRSYENQYPNVTCSQTQARIEALGDIAIEQGLIRDEQEYIDVIMPMVDECGRSQAWKPILYHIEKHTRKWTKKN